jgi:hypothetical protein
MAFALACQLIRCDRIVAPQEQQFLAVLAQQLQFTTARAEQILEVCDLLIRDFVTDQPGRTGVTDAAEMILIPDGCARLDLSR